MGILKKITKDDDERAGDMFYTNPHKATLRISINSAMIGALFFVLTFILSFGQNKFHFFVLAQLVLAIPLLYVSTLTYSKVAYWKQTKLWDAFGWIVTYIGNTILLNAIGLMVASISKNLALTYFILTIVLMIVYSSINIIYSPKTFQRKIFKFLFFLIIILLGGIIPYLSI